MHIRKTVEADLAKIGEIYENAKIFMRATGNPNQWNSGTPNIDTAKEDMEKGIGYVAEENGEILAVFMFSQEDDPTYAKIYGGEWLSNAPYGVIHRIAVAKQGQGIIGYCIHECFARCGNLRMDTHRDNLPMQHALLKHGFEYCGIIRLANGDERLAYQKIKK
ncbi:MAG: GNAT family N-acetyltransferase [Clostridia bacterium]|nr:GNAT family N-acetyltransferase [Clostridia bacterium]